MTQEEFARHGRVSQPLISRICTGSAKALRSSTYNRLTRTLGHLRDRRKTASTYSSIGSVAMPMSAPDEGNKTDSRAALSWFWHHQVNQNLGERLHYYFIKLRQYRQDEIRRRLEELIQREGIGCIGVYTVYGSYHLIVRVWLHPSIAHTFRDQLDSALGSCHKLVSFGVTSIDHVWYEDREIDHTLIQELDDQRIRAIQNGSSPEAVSRLVSEGILLSHNPRQINTHKFFIVIQLAQHHRESIEECTGRIRTRLFATDEIHGEALYRGTGDEWSLLVRGYTSNPYVPEQLTDWIRSSIKCRAEVYVQSAPVELVGKSLIGTSTFEQVSGKSLFVYSIIPELYDERKRNRRERKEHEGIVQFLEADVQRLEPGARTRKLIRDYFLPLVTTDGEPIDAAMVLFRVLVSLESYLLGNVRSFVGKTIRNKSLDQIFFEATGRKLENSKYMVLGDLLAMYGHVLEQQDRTTELHGSWSDLTELRNTIGHSVSQLAADWKGPIRTVLKELGRLEALVRAISSTTGKTFDSKYL